MFDRFEEGGVFGAGAGGPGLADLLDLRPTLMRIGNSGDRVLGAIAGGAGLRDLGMVGWADAGARLERMIGVDVLVLDLSGAEDDDAGVERLLRPVLGWPSVAEAKIIALADLAQIDAVDATLSGLDNELLCDAGPGEIALALCRAATRCKRSSDLHDLGREAESHRLEMLSDEVRRLAQTIDRLAQRDGHTEFRANPFAASPRPNAYHSEADEMPFVSGSGERRTAVVTSAEIRALLQMRRLRDRYLPADLFADPAWDMMLDLMAARLDGKRVSVSSLCIAAAVPPTTALRWIGQLTDRGVFVRTRDPRDARRVFIELSDEAAENVAAWFAAARRDGLRVGGRRGG